MKRDDTVYLQHVRDAITKIETYLTDVDEATFRAQSLIQDGVIRQLEIIGEAVKRLSPVARALASKIPWSAIAGMRDKLIHDYFGVNLDQVWLTATADLPELKKAVTDILELLNPDRWDDAGSEGE
jgi:uncharacterized protein with HEPN domain